MECIIEKSNDFETFKNVPNTPSKYLQERCNKLNNMNDMSRVSKIFEEIAICLPQIDFTKKCDTLLAWTQSIYSKYEHLDRYYHPQGSKSDYMQEISIIEDRCQKLASYFLRSFGSDNFLLPPECGKEREVAKLLYNFKQTHSVAKTQQEYFSSLEQFDCPIPHYICGEQLSNDPHDFL